MLCCCCGELAVWCGLCGFFTLGAVRCVFTLFRFAGGYGVHLVQTVRRRDGGEVEVDLFLRGDGITTIRNRGARDCGETQRKLF